MADAGEWPPKSPMKALLSSPSGLRRYREHQDLGQPSASPNKLLGSLSLLEKLRAARANRDHEILRPGIHQDDEEEDEETLQLKLQAIEAKLKLKKLQQQKARDLENARPQTAEVATTQCSRLEVALSPAKRSIAPSLPKSPNRVLLGIDKGVNAADVSLRRAKVVTGSPAKSRVHHVDSQAIRRPSIFTQCSRPSTAAAASTAVKSFSERMAEMREREQDRAKNASALRDARSSKFKLDKAEMHGYHHPATVTLPRSTTTSALPSRANDQETEDSATSKSIKHSHSTPTLRSISPAKSCRPSATQSKPISSTGDDDKDKGDPSLYEGFSGIHLSSRVLPHTFLKRTLPTEQFTIYTIPKLLKEVHSPDYQMPESVTDYVIFGIIAKVSSPHTHKAKPAEKNTMSSNEWEKKWDDGTANRQKFIILTLTDLKWTLDLFLFGNAVPRYHRLAPGTLIAILNPAIMPPKKGREDTGAFSLALHDGEDQVLEIGNARHLGHCTARKKDEQECSSWIDASKTSICEYHLNAQVQRTRSGRSGLNSMDEWRNNQQKDLKDKSRNKHGFDFDSQSFYYAVGGTAPKKSKEDRWSFAPTHNPNISTAQMLDMSNPDDPFLAEGQLLERDKGDRLRKRMAAMAKEHEIARKLGSFTGNAGGQYMRQRTDSDMGGRNGCRAVRADGDIAGPAVTKEDILADRPGEKSKKRAADSVRLGPVKKKTRFLTDNGIKEVGRESLGAGSVAALHPAGRQGEVKVLDDNDDDDDDLDIV